MALVVIKFGKLSYCLVSDIKLIILVLSIMLALRRPCGYSVWVQVPHVTILLSCPKMSLCVDNTFNLDLYDISTIYFKLKVRNTLKRKSNKILST